MNLIQLPKSKKIMVLTKVIILITLLFSLIGILIGRIISINNYLFIILVFNIFFSLVFFIPLIDFVLSGNKQNCWINCNASFVLQGGIGLFLIFCVYKLFTTNIEGTEHWGWISLIVFVFFWGIDLVRALKQRNYNYPENAGKTNLFTAKRRLQVYSVMFLMIVLYTIKIYDFARILCLDNLKIPEKIVVAQMDKKSNKLVSRNDINDKQVIMEIMQQLNGQKIENIRNMGYLRHFKLSNYSEHDYLLIPIYSNRRAKGLQDGYIDSIVIQPKGYAVIQEVRRTSLRFFKDYYWRYMITISDETLKKIESQLYF